MEYSFATSLGNLANSISKNLGKYIVKQLKEKGIEISAEEWFVISMLYQKKVTTQNELVDQVGQNKVKITRIVDNLKMRKLILRSVSNADQRYKNVELTKMGIELYFKILPIATATIDRAIAGFSIDEYEKMLDYCNRINRNLKSV